MSTIMTLAARTASFADCPGTRGTAVLSVTASIPADGGAWSAITCRALPDTNGWGRQRTLYG